MLWALVAALAVFKDDAAIEEFKQAFESATSEEEKLSTVNKLGELKSPKTAAVLAELLVRDTEAIRIEAAKVLFFFTDVPGTAKLILPALTHKDNKLNRDLRIEIIKTLENLVQKEALPILHDLIQRDKDFEVAKAAVESLPAYKEKISIPRLLEAIKRAESDPPSIEITFPITPIVTDAPQDDPRNQISCVRVSAAEEQKLRHRVLYEPIRDTLRKMTGQRFSWWRSWNEWWLANGARFRFSEE